MSDSINTSIVICCFNSESRILKTLEHISQQTLNKEILCEVILVDNNCTDDTVEVAVSAWHKENIPLSVVRESTPGLSAAREAGVKVARGTLILFCDDDNWLFPDYVQIGVDFLRNHHAFAAVGGWGSAITEENTKLPLWFEQFQTKYACGLVRSTGAASTLVGAGLMIRKEALSQLSELGFRSLLSGRKGSALSSGEDFELSFAFRIAGWKLQFQENLRFHHFMPDNRLTEAYLLQMCEGHGRSRSIFGEYRAALAGRRPGRCYAFRLWCLLAVRVLRFRISSFFRFAPKSLAEKVSYAIDKGSASFECEVIGSRQTSKFTRKLSGNFLNLKNNKAKPAHLDE